jgi:hypothetical protein
MDNAWDEKVGLDPEDSLCSLIHGFEDLKKTQIPNPFGSQNLGIGAYTKPILLTR